MIGAVVVAAGMSSRMGDFKPMLSLGELTISRRLITSLKQAGVDRIVVICGYRAEDLEHHLADMGLVFLRNENYESTDMFESAKIGLSYLGDKCEGLLFTPVDIPLFHADTARTLMESSSRIAIPTYGGKDGHPIFIRDDAIERILKYSGEGGLRGAIECSGYEIERIELSDPGILHDADTPKDYEELLKLHNRQLVRPVLSLSLRKEKLLVDEKIAMLLELIHETSSVSEACKRMQLSYSSGWNIINRLEAQLGYKTVERKRGGREGSGSKLTARGIALTDNYRRLEKELQEIAEQKYREIFKESV